ncbi:MAG: peptidoglycan-binding domain-containing protein, partial [Cyanobacteria bacterium P01_F01_bin.4]
MNLDGRNLSLEMRGEDVRRLQTELKQLGFNLDVSGVFDTVTFVAVEQFQRDRNLSPTGIVDAETARRINAEVDAQNDGLYVVRGQVRRADGSLVSNVVVRLQKKRLRDDQLLGQANVDVGQYSIPYRPDETPISIFVEAVTPGVGEPLVTSAVICSANPVEVVDLTLDGEYRGPSEFKQLQDALLPILKREQVDAATLDEADVALLACKHDLNAQHLAYLVVSVRLAREINAQPEPFYGMVRQGLPPVIEALVAQDQDVLQQAMEASVRDNIVGAHIQDQISDILERLQQHIVTLALRDPEPDRPTLKAYLNLASLPQTRQASLVDRYLKHEGPVQSFWQGLRASDDFEESEVDRIQDTLRIATISLNHLPLIARLAQQYSAGQSGSLRTFLSRLRPAQWRQLLEQPAGGEAIGAPVIFGEDKAQAIERYAAFLPRMVEAVYPTAVLSQQLQQVNPERFARLTQFLDRTGFEFREQRFRDYLREHPDEFEGD